jgi:hypothetical protein
LAIYLDHSRIDDNKRHWCFKASSRKQVDAFFTAGLAAGGRSNGEPSLRPHYHHGYYAAFLFDPAGNRVEAVCGPTGEPTKLVESIFSTIPGSPAFVGKAGSFRLKNTKLGIEMDLSGHNAIQRSFSFALSL